MLWLDGEPIVGDRAPFDLRDRGLLLGDGVFDTSLAVNGRVVFGDMHLARLARSCAYFDIPFDHARVERTQTEAAASIGTGAVRVTVTRGAGRRGLLPPEDARGSVIVAAHPGLPATTWRPLRLALAEIRRNETSPTARHKCLSYVDAIVEMREAARRGADEVLFLNTAGRVASCATGNVFVLREGVLTTPPLEDGALDGITRRVVLDLAAGLPLAVRTQSLTSEDLARADCVFVTNSLRLIAPAVALAGEPLARRGLPRLAALARALDLRLREAHGASTLEGPAAWPEGAWPEIR